MYSACLFYIFELNLSSKIQVLFHSFSGNLQKIRWCIEHLESILCFFVIGQILSNFWRAFIWEDIFYYNAYPELRKFEKIVFTADWNLDVKFLFMSYSIFILISRQLLEIFSTHIFNWEIIFVLWFKKKSHSVKVETNSSDKQICYIVNLYIISVMMYIRKVVSYL